MKHTIDERHMRTFEEMLIDHERSDVTIHKYLRDVETFRQWLGKEPAFDKVRIMEYKEDLQKNTRQTAPIPCFPPSTPS